MDLDQLAVFVSLSKTKNFSRTAEAIHVSQPTVSVRLLALEERLGAQLFERDKRNVHLTPAGIALLPLAQRMIGLAQECRTAVTQSVGPPALVIGLPDSIWRFYAAPPLAAFFNLRPLSAFSVVTGHSWEILDAIHDGTIQVGFSYQEPKAPFLESFVWKQESVVILAHREKALELNGKSIEELFSHPFIYLKNDALVSRWLESMKVLPAKPRITTDQMSIVHDMLCRREGFAILPQSCLNPAVDKTLTIVANVKTKKKPPVRQIHVVCRRGNEKNKLVGELLTYLRRKD